MKSAAGDHSDGGALPSPEYGAIVLCGGKSSRMGSDKARLPFGPETMLQRVVRVLGGVVSPARIVVVAARGQPLPPLPGGLRLALDELPEQGPLEGLAAGLAALPVGLHAVYLTGCDVPWLAEEFVQQMFRELGLHDMAVPFDGRHHHPLAAVCRPSVLPAVRRLLTDGQRRLRALIDSIDAREVPVDDLRRFDPELGSLWNLNSPDDYQSALAELHLRAPA